MYEIGNSADFGGGRGHSSAFRRSRGRARRGCRDALGGVPVGPAAGVRGLSGPEGKTGPDGAGGGSGAQVGKVESARVVDQGDFQQLQPGQVHAGSCGQRALLSIRGPLVVAADVFRSEEYRGAAREAVVPSDLMGAGGQLRQLD